MILDATTKSVELILGAAATANAMPVTVDYVDLTTTTTLAGSSDTQSNGTTAVTIVAAPAASTQRKVNSITVYNADTASKVVTVRLNNNTTLRNLIAVTLQVGDSIVYTDTRGFYVLDANGNIHVSPLTSMTSAQLAALLSDETGSGAAVFGTSPTITSPTITGTDGNWYSSSYTPTITNGTNVAASTASSRSYFTRMGNRVTFNLYADIDLTAAGEFSLTISTPVASNFNNAGNATGGGFSIVGAVGAISDNASARILADVTNDVLQVNGYSTETGPRGWTFVGGYVIL